MNVDDFLQIQENAKITSGAYYEQLRINCSFLDRYPASGYVKITEPGLFLQVPTYTEISQSGGIGVFAVSACYMWLDGEVCFYPGGTLNFTSDDSIDSLTAYAAIKGTPIKEPRVFKDGGNKELLVTHTVELYGVTNSSGSNGWSAPGIIFGRQACLIDKSYRKGFQDQPRDNNYYMKHPGGMWDALKVIDLIDNLVSVFDATTTTKYTVTAKTALTTDKSFSFYETNNIIQGVGYGSINDQPAGLLLFTIPQGMAATTGDVKLPGLARTNENNGYNWDVIITSIGAYLSDPKFSGGTFTGSVTFDGVSYRI